jgi:hypothetical protein
MASAPAAIIEAVSASFCLIRVAAQGALIRPWREHRHQIIESATALLASPANGNWRVDQNCCRGSLSLRAGQSEIVGIATDDPD